ncbi:MAG TPA: pyrimidine 5'-nucleotidase [Thermopetrobacter sp.]|nr:pyrimidine 5'-nucleotidase [Thermopetrobacter sp.]
MRAAFASVRHWVFDLDNTLYSARYRLFDQIDRRMGEYLMRLFGVNAEEARRIQKDYYHRHGTTLRGLMLNGEIDDPHDYLRFVHDIDYGHIAPDPMLDAALTRLKGRKWVFTNGSAAHAEKVMARLGITGHIDAVFDIAAADWLPKPMAAAYEAFLKRTGIAPDQAAMFEDIARNLKTPHELGMKTVLVRHRDNTDGNHINQLNGDLHAPYVQFVTDDLPGFLSRLATENIEETT